MKVEIIFKPQLQSNNEKVRNVYTYSGITSAEVEFDKYDWFLVLSTYLCVTENVKLDDSIDRIRISDFAKGTNK